MKELAVCGGCGQTIDGKFLYCPWCGYSRVSQEKDTLDILFNRYKENQKEIRRKKLEEMEKQLTELEEQLSVLALSAEMHK